MCFVQVKALEQELQDVTQEFQNERDDYLETIRRQDQQVKLLQAILDKVIESMILSSINVQLESIVTLKMF